MEEVLTSWLTECSYAKRLFFVSVNDSLLTGTLSLIVHDTVYRYEFCFEHASLGPYQIVPDEALLLHRAPTASVGRTVIVINSLWPARFEQGLVEALFPGGMTHYLIVADDCCLEVLAAAPPQLSKHALTETH
jgi:hypothetical protein